MSQTLDEKIAEYRSRAAQAHEQARIWETTATKCDGVLEFLQQELGEREQQRALDQAEAAKQEAMRQLQERGETPEPNGSSEPPAPESVPQLAVVAPEPTSP